MIIRDPIEEAGPPPPPCERNYAGHIHDHPRFPSGDCIACGALCTQDCKWEEIARGLNRNGTEV